MLRALALSLCLLSLTTAAISDTLRLPQTAHAAQPAFLHATPHRDGILLQSFGITPAPFATFSALACCKVCTVGKACGDTCIARDKTCHVGPGCAYNGQTSHRW